MKIIKPSLGIALLSTLFLAACGKSTIQENAIANFSYSVTDPMTQEVIASGEIKNYEFTYTGSDLYQLMQGAKKGETRSEVLEDPFYQHDANLVYKQTVLVLNEIGVPAEIGEVVPLSDGDAIITNVMSENGIEQVVIDQNPIETLFPYIWEITVKSIK